MATRYSSLPRRTITIDAAARQDALELWRHGVGLGGINSTPLPPRVVAGAAKLKPRLIRIFIQEFFDISPEPGRLDFSRLDPYMESLAATGASIVAAITIKPKWLFPVVDQAVWRPADVDAYQKVVAALVRRYSVQKRLVTHWEVGNETDIGETGGCPYLIRDPRAYGEYYRMHVKPILETFPAAKVGGPGLAGVGLDYLTGFVGSCREHGLQVDFVSWHLYRDDPQQHAGLVRAVRGAMEAVPGARPELFVTEWSKGFEQVSVEEMAFEPRRAAITAAGILAMREAGLDASFYYHLWDQVAYRGQFEPFFANPRIMTEHWNEIPHRFGLFGVNQEVRPQYFVYQMLSQLGEEQLAAESDEPTLRVLAGTATGQLSALLVNHDLQQSQDVIGTLRFSNLVPGIKRLRVYRIDAERRWSEEDLELIATEEREVDVEASFRCQVYCPADSVVLVRLEDVA